MNRAKRSRRQASGPFVRGRVLLAIVGTIAMAGGGGCSNLGWFEDEPTPLEIGATQVVIEEQIAAERSRLLDLLNVPIPDEDARLAQREIMVAIAARLTRLESALADVRAADEAKARREPKARSARDEH